MQEQQFDVFLSHNNKDRALVRELALRLHDEADIAPWLDAWHIPTGSDWEKEIGRALDTCNVFAVFLGENGWSKYHLKESLEAIERQKTDSKYRIIPILLPLAKDSDFAKGDELFTRLKLLLSDAEEADFLELVNLFISKQRVDFRVPDGIDDDEAFQRLATGIRGKLPFPEGRVNAATIRGDAHQWVEKGKKDKSILYRGTKLREAQRIAKESSNRLNESASQFLATSAFEEQRSKRRLIMSLLGVILVVCVATSWAIYQQIRTTPLANARATAEANAEQQANIAISRRLAQQALLLYRDKNDLGLLLSVEANNIQNTADSQRSLFSVLQTNPSLNTHLRKYEQPIELLSFSPDGQNIGILYEDGTVALWDIAKRSYSTLKSLKGKSICFSPDSKLLAIAEDSEVVLWRIDTGKIVQSVRDLQSEKISLAMNGDGYILISSNGDGSLDVYDLKNNRFIAHYLTSSNQLTFNRDGTLAMSFTMMGVETTYEYFKLDTITGEQIGEKLRITILTNFVSSIAIDQDGNFFLTGRCNGPGTSSIPCAEGGIDMWDSKTGVLIKTFIGHTNAISALAISPNQKIFASAAGSNTTSDPPSVILWDIETGKKIRTLIGHPIEITALDFSPDGKYLASSDRNGNIMLWDMTRSTIITSNGEIYDTVYRADGKQFATMSCTFIIGYCETILWDFPSLQQAGVSILSENVGGSIVAIREKSAIAADYRDGTIMLWDLKNGENIYQLPMSTSISNMAFTPDGKNLLTVSEDNVVSLWDTSNNKLSLAQMLSLEESHSNVSTNPIFDSQGKMAAFIGNSSIMVVNFSNGNIAYLPISGMRYVDKMVFNSNSNLLAVSYNRGMEGTNYQTILWDIKGNNQAMEPFANQVHSIFSSDGKYLASIDRINGIVVRDMASGNIVKSIPQKAPETIVKLFYNQNDKWLISTDENLIYIWDVESGQSIGELSTGGHIRNLAFSPDGVTMAVMGCSEPTDRCAHGQVAFWNLGLESWKQKACDIVGRNLTRSEWTEYIPDKPYEVTCPQYPAGQ